MTRIYQASVRQFVHGMLWTEVVESSVLKDADEAGCLADLINGVLRTTCRTNGFLFSSVLKELIADAIANWLEVDEVNSLSEHVDRCITEFHSDNKNAPA